MMLVILAEFGRRQRAGFGKNNCKYFFAIEGAGTEPRPFRKGKAKMTRHRTRRNADRNENSVKCRMYIDTEFRVFLQTPSHRRHMHEINPICMPGRTSKPGFQTPYHLRQGKRIQLAKQQETSDPQKRVHIASPSWINGPRASCPAHRRQLTETRSLRIFVFFTPTPEKGRDRSFGIRRYEYRSRIREFSQLGVVKFSFKTGILLPSFDNIIDFDS